VLQRPDRDAGKRTSSEDLDATFIGQPALQLVYDTAPIGLAFLSPDCRYLQINQRLTEICGISVADHLGRTVRDCVPALADSVEQIVKSIMETGEPVTGIEVEGQRPDQKEKRFWITYWHPFRGPNGDIVGINVAAEEITERKRTQAALQASERQFHSLADAIPQLAWMASPDGQVFWFNDRWYQYTGWTPDNIGSHDWQALILPASQADIRARWTRTLETGLPLELELSLRGRDSQYRTFLTRAIPLRDANGTVYRWIGTHVDISERERNEREVRAAKAAAEAALQHLRETQHSLIEAEKLAALGRLVAGVAHEINSPVGASLTVASTLEQKSIEFRKEMERGELRRSTLNSFLRATQDACSQLVTNLNRAGELIQSFKQVATDRSESERRSFDAGELIGQVLMSLRPGLRSRTQSLDVACEPALVMDSYPGPLGQVITNLFQNSVMHAFPAGEAGTMTIRAWRTDGETIAMTFADNGRGMNPVIRRQALDPFFTTRRDEGCTGLGLHIVHNIIINRLGGTLSLDSEPGAGTTVEITLPLVAPRA